MVYLTRLLVSSLLAIASLHFLPALAHQPQEASGDAMSPQDTAMLRGQIVDAMARRAAVTKSVRYRTFTTLHALRHPISSFFEDVSPRFDSQRYIYKHNGVRLDGSYIITIERRVTHPEFVAKSGGVIGDTTISNYDAQKGEYKGISTTIIEDGADSRIHATIDGEGDSVAADDRLGYWFTGVSNWQGVNIPDTIAAIISEAELTMELDGEISVKSSAPIPDRPYNIANIVITLDPSRQFMPVMYRYTRSSRQSGTVVWLEGLRVSESMEIDGVWMPKVFDTLQSNMSGEIAPIVYHTVVEELTFSDITASDVSFKFPPGVRVVDRIREQWYVANEKGEPVNTPVPLLIGPRVDGAAGHKIAPGSNTNWKLTILFVNLMAIIVALFCYYRKVRAKSKTTDL